MIAHFVTWHARSTVMAERIPAIRRGAGAGTDGWDKPGHDVETTHGENPR